MAKVLYQRISFPKPSSSPIIICFWLQRTERSKVAGAAPALFIRSIESGCRPGYCTITGTVLRHEDHFLDDDSNQQELSPVNKKVELNPTTAIPKRMRSSLAITERACRSVPLFGAYEDTVHYLLG
jgi:hypothetical protein